MQEILSLALPGDLEALMPLMRAYAAFDGLQFQEPVARAAMGGLLADERLGRVAFVVDASNRCGYLALCYGYSLELGGRDGFLDELYIAPAFRDRGLGARALEAACELARADGVRALHLEVRRENIEAQRYYERAGFTPRDRYYLLTRRLGTE